MALPHTFPADMPENSDLVHLSDKMLNSYKNNIIPCSSVFSVVKKCLIKVGSSSDELAKDVQCGLRLADASHEKRSAADPASGCRHSL